jgi:hypothetical protein
MDGSRPLTGVFEDVEAIFWWNLQGAGSNYKHLDRSEVNIIARILKRQRDKGQHKAKVASSEGGETPSTRSD